MFVFCLVGLLRDCVGCRFERFSLGGLVWLGGSIL